MNQIESRPLRYFIAVAQELNFTRAAQRLGIAGPALSRAIAQLETQVGTTLLQRSTRHVALTEAGAVLLEQAEIALEALDAAVRRAQRAAELERSLVVALKADLDGGLLERAIATFAGEPGAPAVQVLLGGWGEQPGQLRAGEADVALLYLPFDGRDLDHEILLEEPQRVALPAAHPLAARDEITISDLEGGYERVGQYIWHVRGAEPSSRPRIGDISQLLRAIELGHMAAVLPTSVTERFGRPQIAYRPLTDAAPAALSVVWPRAARSATTATFVRVVTELAGYEAGSSRNTGISRSVLV